MLMFLLRNKILELQLEMHNKTRVEQFYQLTVLGSDNFRVWSSMLMSLYAWRHLQITWLSLQELVASHCTEYLDRRIESIVADPLLFSYISSVTVGVQLQKDIIVWYHCGSTIHHKEFNMIYWILGPVNECERAVQVWMEGQLTHCGLELIQHLLS